MLINILQMLETSASNYPHKTFLADSEKAITFSEAENAGKRIGSFLVDSLS